MEENGLPESRQINKQSSNSFTLFVCRSLRAASDKLRQQMKAKLRRHINDIFFVLQIQDLLFEIYECRVDTLPEWTNHVSLAYEFLICAEQSQSIDKLKKFLGKEIYQFEDKVYWFEGDRIIELSPTEIEQFKNTEEITTDYLKTKTRLPAWLDEFIFNQLNAEYAPDFQRFEYNLDLTENENLKYLGTYFPRLNAESFCIFDNIFQNIEYQQTISEKQTLNILSVGCGTGGDLIGLLTIIFISKFLALHTKSIQKTKVKLHIE